MSSAVYPTFQGLMPTVVRAPTWTTNIQRSVSGRELRGSYQIYPVYAIELGYEFLRDGTAGTELAQLTGFYLARQGSYDSFLYSDPYDSSVIDMAFGTGDGTDPTWQLTRTYGAGGFTYAEPVQNVNVLTNVKVAGVTKTLGTDYTISSSGLVTFTTAPAASAALTWTGTYYYRCRFSDDSMPFTRIFNGMWELKKIKFLASLANVL